MADNNKNAPENNKPAPRGNTPPKNAPPKKPAERPPGARPSDAGKNTYDDQNTRQFEAVVTKSSGQRSILRPEKNQETPPTDPRAQGRDIYVSGAQKQAEPPRKQHIMRPPPEEKAGGGAIPVSRNPQSAPQNRPAGQQPAQPGRQQQTGSGDADTVPLRKKM